MLQLAFVRGHRSPFTLSREKQILVGPSLCTTHPSLKKNKFLSPIFLREGVFMHRLVDPKRKKKGGCVAASTDFHFSYNSHYQLKPAVIDRRIKKNSM